MSEPFRRGRFEELPEFPRRAHPYFTTRFEDVPVTTPALGRVRTHVRVHGSGPPLLLVHGLLTTSYSWRYVLEPLVWLDEASHFAHVDAVDRFLPPLLEFLAS